MSTSSAGRDEERKPLLAAYMLQRRILLGCVGLVFVALIFWVIAISTDHWYIISAGKGTYIMEYRRYFRSSHTGIWKTCRYASVPTALPDGVAVRGIPPSPININTLKEGVSHKPFIKDFLNIQLPNINQIKEIDNKFKEKMFALWIINDINFTDFKTVYNHLTNVTYPKTGGSIEPLNPLNITEIQMRIGKALVPIVINSTKFNFIVPEDLQNALFSKWNESADILLDVLSGYAKDLGMSPRVIQNGTLFYIKPPIPPKKAGKYNGYMYTAYTKCKYIDLFPSETETIVRSDTQEDLLDYNRTSASFACIAILIMSMAIAFSIYTFLNPRYTFKRLASGIHFISAACCMVVIQVTIGTLDFQKTIQNNFPAGSVDRYGYGLYIAWLVFTANLIAGILFLWYSGKKKGHKAPTDELAMADEPTIMGR